MTILNHGLTFDLAEDVELARERVRATTMAAEGPLHELGAIPDHQQRLAGHGPHRRDAAPHAAARPRHEGLGGRRERPTTTRASCATWPSAPSSRRSRTALPTTSARCNRAGWPTSCSGSRPGWGSSRRSCSSRAIPHGAHTARATRRSSGPSRAACGRAGAGVAWHPRPSSVTFVSSAIDADAFGRRLGSRRTFLPIGNTRGSDALRPAAQPRDGRLEIDPVTGAVSLARTCCWPFKPASDLPLNRRYFLR